MDFTSPYLEVPIVIATSSKEMFIEDVSFIKNKKIGIVKDYSVGLFLKEKYPDIILMDINLENSKDGISTAIEIKKSKDIPIIYLTAFSDEETINRAIQTNPVGYLIKPYKIAELNSTILLALFKAEQTPYLNKTLNYTSIGDNYFFDEINQELYYQDKPIKLTPKEKQFLALLIESKENIVSFETIEYELWDDTTISSTTLRTFLYRLRAKLEYKLIETVSMSGCRIM